MLNIDPLTSHLWPSYFSVDVEDSNTEITTTESEVPKDGEGGELASQKKNKRLKKRLEIVLAYTSGYLITLICLHYAMNIDPLTCFFGHLILVLLRF